MRPHELAEAVIAASTADHTMALVSATSTVNARWAANEPTTNGRTMVESVTVIAVVDGPDGQRVGTLTRPATAADPSALAAEARAIARAAHPAWDARPLPEAASATGPGWSDGAAEVAIAEVGDTLAELGAEIRRDAANGLEHFGYLELARASTWLASSAGLALRHTQPAGRLELTVKSHQRTRSTWQGFAGARLADADVAGLADRARTELGWQSRTVEIPAGRRAVVLSPSCVADLMIDLLWGADAIAASEGRSVFSAPDGATRLGEQIALRSIRLFSDPAMPRQEGEPWLLTGVSSDFASVFDNGLLRRKTNWIEDGRLTALVSSRAAASDAGVPLALAPDNLALEAGGSGGLADLVGRCADGLLITCTWYNRMVDQQTHLITGLTRDGVYLVSDGEVVGAVGNFRFNCSPVALLDQILDASAPVPALGREMADYFTRTTMPALLVADFNLSSASEAV